MAWRRKKKKSVNYQPHIVGKILQYHKMGLYKFQRDVNTLIPVATQRLYNICDMLIE